jgi:hypothetical protein
VPRARTKGPCIDLPHAKHDVDVNGVLEEAAWDRLSISRSKSVRRSGWPVEEEFRGLRAVEGVAGRLAVVRKGGDGLCEVE